MGNDRSGVGLRGRAADLFGHGLGYRNVARCVGIGQWRARVWWHAYQVEGREGVMQVGVGEPRRFTEQQRLAACRDYVDNGLTIVETMRRHGVLDFARLRRWIARYRRGKDAAMAGGKAAAKAATTMEKTETTAPGKAKGPGSRPRLKPAVNPEIPKFRDERERAQYWQARALYLEKLAALRAKG